MTTVRCPHQEAFGRECPGCTWMDFDSTWLRWCEGEITGRVYRDSDGDAGVIGGIHHFWAVEDEEADCKCQLTETEWDKVRQQLVELNNDRD